MAKTVEQIRDGLAEGDKVFAAALDIIARDTQDGQHDAARFRWRTLPADFRARYEGIDAEGNLIAKAADPHMAQLLAVLSPVDREHAETMAKVGALLRDNCDSDAVWQTLPADVRLRYNFVAGKWVRWNTGHPRWELIRAQEAALKAGAVSYHGPTVGTHPSDAAPDPVMAQVLSVLHPSDREHAETLVRVGDLDRKGGRNAALDLWRTLPDTIRRRYDVTNRDGALHRMGEGGSLWTAFLAEHATLTPSLAGDVGSVRVADDGALTFATSGDATPAAQVAALKAQLTAMIAASHPTPDLATQMQNARAVLSAAGIDTTPKETTTMTTNEKKTGPNLATMATNAAWQAGVIVATNEVRNFIVTLLTMDLPEDRRESGRALAAEMLSGRFGTPLVSAALGVGLFGAEQAGVALPMLSPAVQTRLCEETSTLAMREGMVIAYTAGRDLIATHGKGLLEALGNLNAIAARTHVRIDDGEARDPAEVPAVNGHARTAQA